MKSEEIKLDFENLGAIQAEIDYLEDNVPDKRTKDYKEYLDRINYLTNLYNTIAKDKIYQKLK